MQYVTGHTSDQETVLNRVLHLANLCGFDPEHTHLVTYISLRLFDELYILHHLTYQERFWLHYAAILHDIGMVDGWKNHHKATLRIILSTPLLPFSNRERLLIGSVARYHRKVLPSNEHDHFNALTPEDRQIVRVLAGCLRLANELHHIPDYHIVDLMCTIKQNKIILHCIYQGSVPDENKTIAGKGDLLKEIFERDIIIELKPIS